jgi:hypothetical protein
MDPLDQIPAARFVAELHTENPIWGFRVRDTLTNETFGFGMTIDHALMVAADHEREAKR